MSLSACGDSYRQISTMNPTEADRVEVIKQEYISCMKQKRLDLDDGVTDRQLLVDACTEDCASSIEMMRAELRRCYFSPVEINSFVERAQADGKRKAFEYKSVGAMAQYEIEAIQNAQHDYTKTIVKKCLELDDGRIDPKLLVEASAKECTTQFEMINTTLIKSNYPPSDVARLIEKAEVDGRRRALEAILRMRTN